MDNKYTTFSDMSLKGNGSPVSVVLNTIVRKEHSVEKLCLYRTHRPVGTAGKVKLVSRCGNKKSVWEVWESLHACCRLLNGKA